MILMPLCTLLLQLGDTTSLLDSALTPMKGDERVTRELLFSSDSFNAAGCGDADRVPRQLSLSCVSTDYMDTLKGPTTLKK